MFKINESSNFIKEYRGWGLGIGDWGLGIGANPQSPIPKIKTIKF
jgi:hypothetical protein